MNTKSARFFILHFLFRKEWRMEGRIKYLLTLAAAVGILAAGGWAVWHSKDKPVLRIDSYTVTQAQFQNTMQEYRANTYSYFAEKYGVQDGPDFWETAYDGVTPLDYVKEQAKTDLTEKAVRLSMLAENDILTEISYADFQKNREQENKQRKAAVAQGKVIYGPVEYGQREYEIYILSNKQIELKRILEQSVLQSSEAELRVYYEKNKEVKYKIPDTVVVDADGTLLEFTPQLSRHDSTEYPEIHRAAMEMTPGEKKTVFLADGESVSVACKRRTENGYMSFEDALDSVRQALTDEKFEGLVQNRIAEATITVNQAIYDRLTMD